MFAPQPSIRVNEQGEIDFTDFFKRYKSISMQKGRDMYLATTRHSYAQKGTTLACFGMKGSGKTTLFATMARSVGYIENGRTYMETVIWRGRTVDYWVNFLPNGNELAKKVYVFLHEDDLKRIPHVYDADSGREFKIPPEIIITYSTVEDMLKKIKFGAINVIYEPSVYTFSKTLALLMKRRASNELPQLDGTHIATKFWWFELFYRLVNRPALHSHKYISIFIDEADDIIPSQPGDLDWHMNAWLKDSIKDFRKSKLSLYLACHSDSDIDGRIKSKIQYKIFLRGSRIPDGSLIRKDAPAFLPMGVGFIDAAGWGVFTYQKMQDFGEYIMDYDVEALVKPEDLVEGQREIKRKVYNDRKKNEWSTRKNAGKASPVSGEVNDNTLPANKEEEDGKGIKALILSLNLKGDGGVPH